MSSCCPRRVLGRGKEGTVLCVDTPRGPLAVKRFDKGSQQQRDRAYERHLQFLKLYAQTGMVPELITAGEQDGVKTIVMEAIVDGVETRATREVEEQAAALTGPDNWSDITKQGNFLLRRDGSRPVVFLEGGTRNHPWTVKQI